MAEDDAGVSLADAFYLEEKTTVSELNPYDKFLDGRPLETILDETVHEVTKQLQAMGAEKAAKSPGAGKWSPAEIVAHLADCEIAFGFRLRQTLAEDHHMMQPFDQDKWAATYGGITASQALAAFAGLRNWNLDLIGKTLAHSGGKTVTHPERGTMTFKTIVETMAGHDLNHLGQLKRIAEA
jgi:DinB superfamily